MAASSSSPEATFGPSDSGDTAEGHAATYQDAQLTWNGGKLQDEDIITATTSDGREDGHMVWSLAPTDAVSNPKQPFELQSMFAEKAPPAILDKYLFRSLPDSLDPETRDVYVFISTRSGTGLALDFFDLVLRPLLTAVGLPESKYTVVKSESEESVKKFARSTLLQSATKGRKQTVVLLSGDGGIVDTINGLLENENQSRYV
jgi:hypothetical protein